MSKRTIISIASIVSIVIVGAIIYILASGVPGKPTPRVTPSAIVIEQRYDDKDPAGKDDPSFKCSDPEHPSQPITQLEPSLVGPDGRKVGRVQLRTSPICPVIWARVYWIKGKYRLPSGWSLHIVMHRPTPAKISRFIAYDTSDYVYGNMLATVRGCVYAEVFFAKGSHRTTSARTQCRIST